MILFEFKDAYNVGFAIVVASNLNLWKILFSVGTGRVYCFMVVVGAFFFAKYDFPGRNGLFFSEVSCHVR